MLLAIPTTRDDFERDRADDGKDFVRNVCPVWEKYVHDVLTPWNWYRRRWAELGVVMREGSTLQTLAESTASSSAIILIAHWTEGGVEFADRIVSDDEFIDAVPDENVIIDLSVCHPMRLARRLRDVRQRAVVRDSERAATVFLWLHFYAVVFQYLHEKSSTYMEAFEYAHDALWKMRGS